MTLRRVVVDNSAILPAFFGETNASLFDAKLVTARSIALVHAIRMNAVSAYVPPSFFREFLNRVGRELEQLRGGAKARDSIREEVRQHWHDLLSLPLIVIDVASLYWRACDLTLDAACPAADSWYVAAAEHADATFWMSHRHSDDLYAVASQHVAVSLLSDESPIG